MGGGSLKFDRRKFLATASGLGVAGALYGFGNVDFKRFVQNNAGTSKIRAGRYVRPVTGSILDNLTSDLYTSKALFELNLATGASREITSSVPAHVVETHPFDSNLAIVASKKADKIAIADWGQLREVSVFQLPDQKFFYGHAAFTDDGAHVIAPILSSEHEGKLGIFEVPSLRQTGEIEIRRGIAHEILPLGNNQFLFSVGSHEALPAAFAKFNFADSTIEYFDTEFGGLEQAFSITHIERSNGQYLATLNANDRTGLADGAIVRFDDTTKKTVTEIPLASNLIHSEALSLEFHHETQNLWFTMPAQNEVIVWNVRDEKMVRSIPFKLGAKPTAISFVPETNCMLVVCRDRFYTFDVNTGSNVTSPADRFQPAMVSGTYCAHFRRVTV